MSTSRRILHHSSLVGSAAVLATGTAGTLLAALASPASAATTFTVDSAADANGVASHCTDGITGNCTFRDASLAAQNGDTINFDLGTGPSTITLASIPSLGYTNQILVSAVTISGPGSDLLTIQQNEPTWRALDTAGYGSVSISGITFSGGGIRLSTNGPTGSTQTVDDVRVTGADAPGGYGGGLTATTLYADVVITNSTFDHNTSVYDGAGLKFMNRGSVSITGTTISDNTSTYGRGAGVFAYYSNTVTDLTITDSTFTNNVANGAGGAVFTQNTGDVTISGSTFAHNTANESGSRAGGGTYISTPGEVAVSDSTFDSNSAPYGSGGGLLVDSNAMGTTILSSTFTGNSSARSGSAVYSSNALIANSTITGNASTNDGGALYFNGGSTITLDQDTIAQNSGGGLKFYAYTLIDLAGTIVSSNTEHGSSSPNDIVAASGNGSTINSDHSMLGVGAAINVGSATLNDVGGTVRSDAPGLYALADNGGSTKTMELTATSPAIDSGPNPVATFSGNSFDQRGTGFDRVVNNTVDIGAFEVQNAPTPTSSTTSTSTSTSSTTSTTTGPTPSTTIDVGPNAPATPSNGTPLALPPGTGAAIDPNGGVTTIPVTSGGSNAVTFGNGTSTATATGASVNGTTLTFDPNGTAHLSGTGFLPGSTVSAWLMSPAHLLGTATVDGSGAFTITFTVPNDMSAGDATVQIQGLDTNGDSVALAAGLTLSTNGSALPSTGRDLTMPIALGAGLLLAGAAGTTAARRARRPIGQHSR